MMLLGLLNMLRGKPEKVVKLEYNFLRNAFQTTTPGMLRQDENRPFTPASELVRETFAKFSIDGVYSSHDVRRFRVNQSGAAAIFTEAATCSGKGSKTALFMLTQSASPRPSDFPYLETEDSVPVFVFAGQYREIEGKPAFLCTAIHHKTADISADTLACDARKDTVRVGNDFLEVVNALAFGEQCFQQFLRGERLRPEAAEKAVARVPVKELYSHYQNMNNPQRSDSILQLAARLPS